MKKLFAILLMALTVAALSLCSFAVSRGNAIVEDNGYYDDKITETTPGSTVYIALAEAKDEASNFKISSKLVPTSAKVTSAKTKGYIDDKDHKLIDTGKLDIEKFEVEDGSEWYFAVLKIKDIDVDDYPEDGFDVDGTIKVTRKGGSTFSIDLEDSLDFIRFSEAKDDDKLLKSAQIYKFKGNTEFELEFPNGEGYFSGETKGSVEVLAAMNHAKISAITKKDKNAEMTFYIGNDAKFSGIRDGLITINADNGCYLYKIGKNNALDNMTNTYDEDEEAFLIKTNVLGKYVVSDEKLSASSSGNSSSRDEDEDEEEKEDTYIYVAPINPSTGAAV